MTESERDREIREAKARLAAANEECAAILLRLRRYCGMFRCLSDLCDGLLRDYAVRTTPQPVPDGLPSTDDLRQLLADLRTCTQQIAEYQTLLRQAGFS